MLERTIFRQIQRETNSRQGGGMEGKERDAGKRHTEREGEKGREGGRDKEEKRKRREERERWRDRGRGERQTEIESERARGRECEITHGL